jgi:hypothetical protein
MRMQHLGGAAVAATGIFLAVALLAGCASLPPAKAIQDVKVLAGNWEGWGSPPSGGQGFSVKATIKEDGSYVSTTSNSTLTGTVYLSGGQALYKNSRPSSGTVTLYQGEGKRILRFVAADGFTAEMTPVK